MKKVSLGFCQTQAGISTLCCASLTVCERVQNKSNFFSKIETAESMEIFINAASD